MEKPVIKEFIVVEGRDDTTAIQRAVQADTIETNGSEISKPTIDKIKFAKEQRGVIIFTDPDFPGEKIRKTIEQEVPGCKHAFIQKKDALPKHGRGLGVEHAAPQAIHEALHHFQTSEQIKRSESDTIPREWLIERGLLGGPGAAKRREQLGNKLRIGYTNGKQLAARLRMFTISKQQFLKAWEDIVQEEKDE